MGEPALVCDSWAKQDSRPQDVSIVSATEEAVRVTGSHLDLPGAGSPECFQEPTDRCISLLLLQVGLEESEG